jgi:hypothetical protein
MSNIFDSLVHSGLNPIWPSKPDTDLRISSVIRSIESNTRLSGACIQTSPWYDCGYSPELFYQTVSNPTLDKEYYPVFSISSLVSFQLALTEIHLALEIGYKVFKIHPRFADSSYQVLYRVIDYLLSRRCFVQLCTYQYRQISSKQQRNNCYLLPHLIHSCCELANRYRSYICLMHGFGTQILEAHNYVRHNPYLLLDLSMTILKYKGSSLDLDLHYLFNSFDQRICVGSDYPEWDFAKLIQRFDLLSTELDPNKVNNVGYLNLLNALNHG